MPTLAGGVYFAIRVCGAVQHNYARGIDGVGRGNNIINLEHFGFFSGQDFMQQAHKNVLQGSSYTGLL